MGVCLACGSGSLELILDLGQQWPANNLSGAIRPSARYPLNLFACLDCGHGQLGFQVPPEELFEDYLYSSGTSQTLRRYMDSLANLVCSLPHSLNSQPQVLEIASNDGLFLAALQAHGAEAIGVDPAQRMVERATERGLQTIADFWPQAKGALGGRAFDVIVGQNVLAHTPSPKEMLAACRDALRDEGLVVFQTSQTDMLEHGEFDTVYHEHYSFFSEQSARRLGHRCGFTEYSSRYVNIHGNSALHVFSNSKNTIGTFEREFDSQRNPLRLSGFVEMRTEVATRVCRTIEDWTSFADNALERMATFRDHAESFQEQGYQLVAVGAAAKAITFLRSAGVQPDFLVDESPDKIGRKVDGLSATISDLPSATSITNPLFFIAAWNFSSELAAKLLAVGLDNNAPAIVIYPTPRLATLQELV